MTIWHMMVSSDTLTSRALALISTRHHLMRLSFVSFICAVTILGVTLALLPYKGELNHLGPDTLQYLEYSDVILSNHLLNFSPVEELPKSVVVRTPGFPALLAVGRSLFPNDLRSSLLFIHTALGLLSGIFVCLVFRRYIPVWGSAAILAVLFFHLRPWFYSISTEWTTFSLTLVFLGSTLSYFQSPSPRRLAVWAAAAALLPVVRPNFALSFVLPLVSVLALPANRRRAGFSALALGFSPLLTLFFLNYLRFGVLSLTPYGGRNLFIAGILSGSSEVPPNDRTPFSVFSERVNQQKNKFSSVELNLAEGDPDFKRYFELYSRDFYMVEDIAKELSLSHIELNQYTGSYAIRAIGSHFKTYLSLQLRWHRWLAEKIVIFIPIVSVALLWARHRRHLPLVLSF